MGLETKVIDGKHVYKIEPTVYKKYRWRNIITALYGYPNFTPEFDQQIENNILF